MATAKTTKESYALNFWRLFHCFILHGREENEVKRAKATWSWVMDNVLSLRKACVDVQLDILNIVWKCSMEDQILPAYELVLERVQGAEKNDALLDALKEYKEFAPNLHIIPPENLASVFSDLATDWEKERIMSLLRLTSKIVNGSLEEGKLTWKGPRDGLHYLMSGLESGLLINQSNVAHPINVKNEAEGTMEWYEEMGRRGFIEAGFEQFQLQHGNFIGILGYAGDGKSTLLRYMLYNMACNNKHVMHISLENDAAVERNKFIIMHAHHPKFGGEFNSLSYEKFKRHALTHPESKMMREVIRDFKQTVDGNITIHQPMSASWNQCKTYIEMQDLVQPVDAVGIDYLQLIDPPTSKNDNDQRAKMTSMVKDVRQYGLTFGGSRKLCIISPIQSNEEGLKRVREADGVWTLSGINNDKELGRSCDFIIGVFSKGDTKIEGYGAVKEMVLSCVKERDGVGFPPFFANLTSAGMILPRAGSGPAALPQEEVLPDMFDDLG